jgi:hypothetical protein
MRSGKLIATNDHLITHLLNKPEYYWIGHDGSVWTKITRTGKVSVTNTWRRCDQIKNGYRAVSYSLDEKRYVLAAHRIVYAKFVGDLEPDLVINHKDGNSLNNDPTNLELISQAKNNLHSFRVLNKKPVMGNKTLNWEVIRELRNDRKSGMTYRMLRQKYHISKGHISQIVLNKIWIEGKEYA